MAHDCGFNFQDPNSAHALYPEHLKLEVTKRTADLVYYLPNRSVIAIDNVSPKGETQYVDPGIYLGFFSTIFPIWPQTPPDPSQENLEQLLLEISQTACQFQSIQKWDTRYISLLALPFITQQHSIERMPDLTSLPSENNITVSFVTPRTKISLSPTSFWVYCIFTMLSIGSCGVLIRKIFLVGGPELLGFAEIDFVLKELGFFKEELGETPSQDDIFRKLAQTRLRVTDEKQTLELNTFRPAA